MSLTKKEAAWIARVQRELDACPSPKRMGFYTTGDRGVTIYDKSLGVDLQNDKDGTDFCCTVQKLDAELGQFNFPANVHSTAG